MSMDTRHTAHTAPVRPLGVSILVLDDVEVPDFAGPYEVFTTASGVIQREQATTQWEDIDDLRRAFPQLDLTDTVRWPCAPPGKWTMHGTARLD